MADPTKEQLCSLLACTLDSVDSDRILKTALRKERIVVAFLAGATSSHIHALIQDFREEDALA